MGIIDNDDVSLGETRGGDRKIKNNEVSKNENSTRKKRNN